MQSKKQMSQQVVVREQGKKGFNILTTYYGFVPRVGEEIEIATSAEPDKAFVGRLIFSYWKVVRVSSNG